jgi:hypothetical protein
MVTMSSSSVIPAKRYKNGEGKENYVDPKRFTELLLTFQETESPSILDALIKECFYPIALGLIRKKNIRNIDLEDAVQECVIQCVENISKYNPRHETVNTNSSGDPERKAFSFFTTCVSNTVKGLLRKRISKIRGEQAFLLNMIEKDPVMAQDKMVKKIRDEIIQKHISVEKEEPWY